VKEDDAIAAEEILRFALFKEVIQPVRTKRRKLNTPAAESEDEESEEEEVEGEEQEEGAVNLKRQKAKDTTPVPQAAKAGRYQTRAGKGKGADDSGVGMMSQNTDGPADETMDTQEDESQPEPETQEESQAATASGTVSSPARAKLFRELLAASFKTVFEAELTILLPRLLPEINRDLAPSDEFDADQARTYLDAMDADGLIMFSSDTIYRM